MVDKTSKMYTTQGPNREFKACTKTTMLRLHCILRVLKTFLWDLRCLTCFLKQKCFQKQRSHTWDPYGMFSAPSETQWVGWQLTCKIKVRPSFCRFYLQRRPSDCISKRLSHLTIKKLIYSKFAFLPFATFNILGSHNNFLVRYPLGE